MRRRIATMAALLLVFAACTTIAYALANDISIPDTIKAWIRYDFSAVEERRETAPSSPSDADSPYGGFMTFLPSEVTGGWLYDLAGGAELYVATGTLTFDGGAVSERYMDIKGKNGEVRLLCNSFSKQEGYNKTLFWSFKRQEGASIVKGADGDVKCAVLYECPDGSLRLTGYIDQKGGDFWSSSLPESGYYAYGANEGAAPLPEGPEEKAEITDKGEIDRLLTEIMSSPSLSSRTGDYIDAHPKEFDRIVAMGEEALPYLTEILNSGDRGLRGNIAAILCNRIMENISKEQNSPEREKIITDAKASVMNWHAGMGYPPPVPEGEKASR